MKKRLIIIAVLLVIAIPLAGMGLANLVVYDLSRPKPAQIPPSASFGDYKVEEVKLTASDGIQISGWLARVPGKKAVILLHGISANRMQHMEKAALYTQLGYAVLSYDARSHGASQTTVVTGGWTERLDLEAAVAYMRSQGYEDIGLDGFSMGAATITFANQDEIKPAFIVLESCYKDVDTLIHNAVERMHLPGFFALPVLSRIASKMGAPIDQLSPIARLPHITAPTLMLLGDSEFQVHKDQADEMLAACGAKVKQLFMFEHAGHDVFSATQPDLYKTTLMAFLKAANS